MTLNQKMAKLRESLGENPDIEEASALCKQSLTKLDKSKLWQKGQFAMGHNKALEDAYNAAETKKAKGHVLTAWSLDPDGKGIFKTVTAGIQTNHSVLQTNRWVGQSKALQDWTPEELDAHLKSGRFSCKEDPDTPGVWLYKDNKDITQTKKIDKERKITGMQQTEVEGEDYELFQSLYDSCCLGLTDQAFEIGAEAWSLVPSVKGAKGESKGKGKGKTKGPGHDSDPDPDPTKGKGKGKGKEITEDTANSKGKQALSLVQKTALMLEEDRAKVKGSSYWNKKIQAQFVSHEAALEEFQVKIKKALISELYSSNIDSFKKLLTTAVMAVKGFNDFKKEHSNIASSAASVRADED